MASTWSSLGIRLMTTGENANAWGDQTNQNWERLEDAADGLATVAVTGATSLTFTPQPTSYADENGRNKVLVFTGTAGSTQAITFPNIEKTYHVLNDSNSTLTLTTGTGAATVSLEAGKDKMIYNDGSDEIHDALANLAITTLDISSTLQVDGSITSSDGMTITTADNTDTLTLTSTDADASVGPNLRLYRNSSSPEDGDQLAKIDFEGRNDNSQDVSYFDITSYTRDVSDGEEDGILLINGIKAGSSVEYIRIDPHSSHNGIVFNDGSTDMDFRVETNGNANMLFVDGGNNCVNIGTTTNHGGELNIETTGNATNLALVCTDDDANQGPILDFYRNSANPADNDGIGQINFTGRNDNSQNVIYGQLLVTAQDVSDGEEDGVVTFSTMKAGSLVEQFGFNASEAVFNNQSNDIDFRVESNDNANAIFVNAATNSVTIGASGTVSSIAGVNVLFEANSIFIGDDVSGTTDTAANSVALGIDALDAVTTGDANVAVGKSTLSGNTTGGNNIAIGNQALNAPDTESNNLAIGSNALNGSIAGGEYNVAIGNSSLAALTSSDANVAIGYNAGADVSTGDNSVYVGYQAGLNATTGSSNTFIGMEAAGLGVVTGTANVAVGVQALYDLTSGADNTAIGYRAGYNITTGPHNVLIGKQAGEKITEGEKNIIVGSQAGAELVGDGGDFNILIGYAAGNALTTTNSSIFIGHESGDQHDTETNNIGMGRGALGGSIAGGEYNVAIGNYALQALTSGDFNTTLGYHSGTNLSTGQQNVYVGYQAGKEATTADGCTVVGRFAGGAGATATGNLNVFIGNSAGAVVTSGATNTAVGSESGSALTTGSGNVFLGDNSGTSSSPFGELSDHSNHMVLGHNNITNAGIKVALTVTSDGRDKTDIEPFKMGLDFVKELNPVTYRWDMRSNYADKTPDGTHKKPELSAGLIAQDVEKLEREYGYKVEDKTSVITYVSSDGDYSLTFEKFIPVLINAVQELSATVTTLQQEINTLKGE